MHMLSFTLPARKTPMKHVESQRTIKVAVLMVDIFAPIPIIGPMDMLDTLNASAPNEKEISHD